jgi:hypothetical protein
VNGALTVVAVVCAVIGLALLVYLVRTGQSWGAE